MQQNQPPGARTHYNEVIDYCVQEGELDKALRASTNGRTITHMGTVQAYSWLTLMKDWQRLVIVLECLHAMTSALKTIAEL